MTGIWAVLGVPTGSDRDTIRRAYARKLRVTNPEDDPEGFKRLREAYDSALAHVDYVSRWGDDDDDDEEAEDFADAEIATDPLARPDPSVLWHDAADAPEPSEEARALLAGRDDDLAALRRAMADLDAALRSAWRPPDAEIEALFDQILSAPALGEITVRGDVEAWTAELIADTIPQSDAILVQAVTAFGWSETGTHRGGYAVHTALERLDEWRLIATFRKPGHTLNPAWQSLTKPPARQPWWRLKALSPSLTHGVRSLLGELGYVSPGLHFSFNAESVERWRAFLAVPRLTLGMVLLTFAVWSGLNAALATIPALDGRAPYWAGAIILVLSIATPVAVLRVTRWFERSSGVARTVVAHGWFPAFAALGLLAILLPAEPTSAIAVTLGALVVLGWFAVATDREARSSFWGAAGRWLIGGWLYLILGVPIAMRLVPPAMLVLADIAVLAFVLCTTMIGQVRDDLDRFAPERPVATAAGIVALIGGLGIAATAARLALYHGGDGAVFIGGAVTLLLVLPGLAVFGAAYVRWVLVVHIALAVVFVFAIAGPMLPDTRGNPDLRQSVTLSQDDVLRNITDQRPGLDQLKAGNPAAWTAIATAAAQRARRDIDDRAMSLRINRAVDTAYRERIAHAPAAMIAEERRIKLAEWLEVRKVSVAACARDDMSALKEWPEPLKLRLRAHIYAVAAAPAAPRKGGSVIAGIDLAKGAARIIDRPVADLVALLDSKAETAAVCDARIALLQALVGYPDDDIAATVRAAPKKKAASTR